MNKWWWDLTGLESITLGYKALDGKEEMIESNELIMKSMNNDDWLNRSSFSISYQRRKQFQVDREGYNRRW